MVERERERERERDGQREGEREIGRHREFVVAIGKLAQHFVTLVLAYKDLEKREVALGKRYHLNLLNLSTYCKN